MGCCDQKRQTIRGAQVVLESTNPTEVTLLGPATGRHYRFAGAGSRVRVDAKDYPYLTNFKYLKRIA